jgi:hypothetical protein
MAGNIFNRYRKFRWNSGPQLPHYLII